MKTYTHWCTDELELTEVLESIQNEFETIEITDIKPIVYPVEGLNASNYQDLGAVNYLIIYKA